MALYPLRIRFTAWKARALSLRHTRQLPLAPGARQHLLAKYSWKGHVVDGPPVVLARTLPLRDADWVLGVERDGQARMYPVDGLATAHIVNDVFDGRSLAVTFCPACGSGLAFTPVVDGRVLAFDVYGLYQGNEAMADRQTGSVWSQMTGTAIVGPLAGSRLPFEPVQMMPYGEWLTRYPDSTAAVLDRDRRKTIRFRREFQMSPLVRRTLDVVDDRLPAGQWVVGVSVRGAARAYVLADRSDQAASHEDHLAGIPIVLLSAPGGWPSAFDRRVDGITLALRVENGTIVDRTGSTWTSGGRAIAGPLRGTALRPVDSRLTRWFAWAAAFPATEIRHMGDVGAVTVSAASGDGGDRPL